MEQPFKRAGQIKCASVHSWHVTGPKGGKKPRENYFFMQRQTQPTAKQLKETFMAFEMRHIAFVAPISLKQNVFFLNIPAFSALTLVTIQ